jgi:hypothetical protein
VSTVKTDAITAVTTDGDLSLDGLGTGGVSIASTLKMAKGGDIASASPLVIDTDGNYFDVTGTTNFAAMTVESGNFFMLQFDGVLTITHGSGIELPGAANLTTAAGDRLMCYATSANTVEVMSVETEAAMSVVSGGTGASTHTANNVLVGAGTSAIASVAPSTSGNILTSNGSAWTSAAAAGGISVYAAGTVASGTTAFTRATWTNVAMTETADSGTAYDGTTFTVPTGEGGTYELLFGAGGDFNAAAGNDGENVEVRLDKNSGTYLGYSKYQDSGATLRWGIGFTGWMGTLAAGDTIVPQALLNDANASGSAALYSAFFSAKKVA